MRNKIAVFLGILFLAFFSCGKDEQLEPADLNYDYYPLSAGNSWTYKIDSVVYDDFNQRIDTFSFLQKEQIESIWTSTFQDTSYRLQYFQKENDSDLWDLKRVGQLVFNKKSLLKIDNNLAEMILIFPIREDESWNENAMNTKPRKTVNYTNIDKPFSANGTSYPKTATVAFNFFDTILTNYTERSIYAQNFGLIFQNKTYIDLQKDSGLVYQKVLLSVDFE